MKTLIIPLLIAISSLNAMRQGARPLAIPESNGHNHSPLMVSYSPGNWPLPLLGERTPAAPTADSQADILLQQHINRARLSSTALTQMGNHSLELIAGIQENFLATEHGNVYLGDERIEKRLKELLDELRKGNSLTSRLNTVLSTLTDATTTEVAITEFISGELQALNTVPEENNELTERVEEHVIQQAILLNQLSRFSHL